MIEIEVCVGSSCFLRGAGKVVSTFQELVENHQLQAQVILRGRFCMEHCTEGVTIRIGEKLYQGVFPEEIPTLFAREILHEGKD